MKKTILGLLSLVILFSTICAVEAKTYTKNAQTAEAIRLYKSGDYTQSYFAFSQIVKKDSSNALAAYYLGMSAAQLGRSEEAIANYEKAAALSPNGILGSYAKRGIKCVETPDRCHEKVTANTGEETEDDKFIKSGASFSQKARGVYEQDRMNQIMRDMNRGNEIAPQKFKDYKDFSSQAPSNEEVVEAMRTLQRAGIGSYGYNSAEPNADMFRALFGYNGNSNINPQVIQSLLTTQMTTNF